MASFELTGGALCLDFANTLDLRPSGQPEERLEHYGDLLRWAVQARALPDVLAGELQREATRHPQEARSVLFRCRELREALFRLFSAAAEDQKLPGDALEMLNAALPAALARMRLVPHAGAPASWGWDWDARALACVSWPVLRSAAELLASPDLARVRVCAAEACDWLFLDQSRNHSRRWCDMSVCGNRDKVVRFRQRTRRKA
jgi:predicted RNA-binding Zn ribbon-like protein